MIISNATPLIAFTRIAKLSLLQKVVGELVIPLAVAQEIRAYQPSQRGSIDLDKLPWIQVRSLQSDQQVRLLLPTLDQGEAEVIALVLEVNASRVLMDELTGRKVAESLNLRIVGSVGILIRAKPLGHIPAIQPYLQQMRQAGIYFSDRFIDAVLRQVNEI
jgi:predicted nucleic acid-binding protein